MIGRAPRRRAARACIVARGRKAAHGPRHAGSGIVQYRK
ncbi:hypothetical protein BURMUCGD2_6185 [Burkholderia multivorans CGD2]|uniref:Uncharacterized protein n=1 Tax=Burkholderia multivorans CGD2 TaxID=513052 RepID=B9BWU8_9BURK|nr:hypothetical protein BURMUCGD2_6185 [Burkholderia multivorans CGD2]